MSAACGQEAMMGNGDVEKESQAPGWRWYTYFGVCLVSGKLDGQWRWWGCECGGGFAKATREKARSPSASSSSSSFWHTSTYTLSMLYISYKVQLLRRVAPQKQVHPYRGLVTWHADEAED